MRHGVVGARLWSSSASEARSPARVKAYFQGGPSCTPTIRHPPPSRRSTVARSLPAQPLSQPAPPHSPAPPTPTRPHPSPTTATAPRPAPPRRRLTRPSSATSSSRAPASPASWPPTTSSSRASRCACLRRASALSCPTGPSAAAPTPARRRFRRTRTPGFPSTTCSSTCTASPTAPSTPSCSRTSWLVLAPQSTVCASWASPCTCGRTPTAWASAAATTLTPAPPTAPTPSSPTLRPTAVR